MTTIAIIVTVIAALLSGLAVQFFNNLLARRRIKYSADGIALLESRENFAELTITHQGVPVSRLTKSHVWLWNAGGKAIRPTDVLPENPIALSFPGEKILSVKVIHNGPDTLNFSPIPTKDGEKWVFNFNYWAKRSGVVLEVLHTSKNFVPVISGTVDDLAPIKSLGRIATGSLSKTGQFRYHGAAPFLGLLLMILGVVGVVALKLNFDLKTLASLVLIAPGEFFLITSLIAYGSTLLVPRNIRHFNDSCSPP